MAVTSVSFVCSSRSVLSSTCQEDKSVFANSDSFPNLELTSDRWLGGAFNLITLQQTKHWAQYLQEFNATICSKFSNINNPMHPMQAFVMKTLVTMRGKTITTLFMNVLKHSRCMEQSNPIVLLFRVVLKQLNQTPEIGGAINWSV